MNFGMWKDVVVKNLYFWKVWRKTMLDAKCKEPFKDRISNSIVNVKKKGWFEACARIIWGEGGLLDGQCQYFQLSSSELWASVLLPSLQANHIHKRLTVVIFSSLFKNSLSMQNYLDQGCDLRGVKSAIQCIELWWTL